MTLLQTLLRATSYRTPLLRTLLPTVALAYGLQTAVALPSIAYRTERFYDLSGSLTYLSCTAVSLALPFLRARAANPATTLTQYFAAPAEGQAGWYWRHVVLSAAVGLWATRLGTYLFKRISGDGGEDSRFEGIRESPVKFWGAFAAQATWVSLCLLPVVCVNSLPRSAFAAAGGLKGVVGAQGAAVKAAPYWTDVLGIAMFVFGLAFEVAADRQKSAWVQEKKEKKHSEEFLTRGLWGKSRHPNYFGEITLWTGIAVAAGGLLVRQPAQVGLGLAGWGAMGKIAVAGMCAASPAFVAFLLLKVSGIPMSENKYDKRYGDRKDYKKWKEETPMLIPKF